MKKLKLQVPSPRQVSAFAFLLCVFLLSASAYFQFQLNLAPCSLCIIQRIVMVLLGAIFLFYPLHKPLRMGRRIYNTFALLLAILGIVVAGRQVWLEYMPSTQVAPCGATLNELLANLPLSDALLLVFRGTGDCSKVTWQFLNLSMPAWTLIFFVLFALIAIWQIVRK